MSEIIKKLPKDLQRYIIFNYLLCPYCGNKKHSIKRGSTFIYKSYFNGFYFDPRIFIYVINVKNKIANCFLVKLKGTDKNSYKKIKYNICFLSKFKKLTNLYFL